MKILALDTSSDGLSVAIMDDDNLLGEYFVNGGKKNHSQKLMPMIKEILEDLDIAVQDIDYYAVSIGPGSFTGLRIGITTVKGMAFSNDKQVVGVNTLDALACNVSYIGELICPIIDAKNNQVYTAIYDKGKKIVNDNIILINELANKLKFLNSKIIFVGDGVVSHEDYLKKELKENCIIARQPSLLALASSIAQVASEKIKVGEVSSSEDIAPNYLIKSQAEREYEKSHNS